jgi:glyoxylase-like metal-dependent hydrolase (beta-lactamase superfamily II)
VAKNNLKLIQGNTFFFDGIFSVGVYKKNKKTILIDSGISKDLAKEFHKILIQEGDEVIAIINTHCHGDHCGGNAYFQEKIPPVKVFSTETEKPFIEDPLLAPICFCGGAAAFEELKKCKPITPQQVSKVTDIIAPYQDQNITIAGETFEIFTLPGHTRGMIAVRTPDNVLFCGDAVFGEATFKKYPILFYTAIHDTLHSFNKLRSLIPKMDVCVLYHGGIVSNLASLIDDHEQRIRGIQKSILSLLQAQPLSVEEITAKIMQQEAIPDDLVAYALTRTPIQAYLAELERENWIEMRVTQGISRAHALEKNTPHATHPDAKVVM